MAASSSSQEYVVGVMTIDVEGKNSERFRRRVTQAVEVLDQDITSALGVRVELIAFEGPHLTPAAGAYAPFDFLRIGMTEKLERGIHFLLIVTEVDLAATTLSYTLALPSPLTNIGVVSVKRLDPAFWGDKEDEVLAVRRLTALLLHTFGHLLNLSHTEHPQNVMHDFVDVDDLDVMTHLTDAQREQMRCMLPREAHERTRRDQRWQFALHTLLHDWRSIVRVSRAPTRCASSRACRR